MRLKILNCAELVGSSYGLVKAIKRNQIPPNVVDHMNHRGAQAVMLDHNVLVIPGSNELVDWFRNFDTFRIAGQRFNARAATRHKTGAFFHSGFYKHAGLILEFAKDNRAKFIIGHSLGAAAAQILGTSLNVPTVGFASPRVKKGNGRLKNEDKVLNICRVDDLVTRVPPSEVGFRRLGQSVRLIPPQTNPGMDHSMPHYIDALKFDTVDGALPRTWG